MCFHPTPTSLARRFKLQRRVKYFSSLNLSQGRSLHLRRPTWLWDIRIYLAKHQCSSNLIPSLTSKRMCCVFSVVPFTHNCCIHFLSSLIMHSGLCGLWSWLQLSWGWREVKLVTKTSSHWYLNFWPVYSELERPTKYLPKTHDNVKKLEQQKGEWTLPMTQHC